MVSHEEYLEDTIPLIKGQSNECSPLISPALSLDSTDSEYPNSACSTSDSSSITFSTAQNNYSPTLSISQRSFQAHPETDVEEDSLEEERRDQFSGFSKCQHYKLRCVGLNKQFSTMSESCYRENKTSQEASMGDENNLAFKEKCTNKIIKEAPHLSSCILSECASSTASQCEDCVFVARPALPSSPSRFLRDAFSNTGRRKSRNRLFSSASSGIRTRLSSLSRSLENSSMEDNSTCSSNSTDNSDLCAAKSNYRIMILGAKRTGKTSIIQQFLYDKFSSSYKETIDDMYRGEFDIHGRTIGFDIQDVSGGYVYDFPGMRTVSFASADAFVLVYSLDSFESWQEVESLRAMIHSDKGVEVPIVIVGNKSDLKASFDTRIPHESVEATVVFDWENGYVESSSKDRFNINKIFKELLQQSKTRYYFDTSSTSSASYTNNQAHNSTLSPFSTPIMGGQHPSGFDWIKTNTRVQCSKGVVDDCLKRRQSLPAVCPAHTFPKSADPSHTLVSDSESHVSKKKILYCKSQLASENKNDRHNTISQGQSRIREESPTPDIRRLSLATPRKDSCKIS